MSMLVPTVTGDISIDELGFTLPHEHIVLFEPELDQNYPGWWNESEQVGIAQDRLCRLKQLGVDSLIDMTVLGLGRNVELIRRIAEPTGINVLVATGAYTMDDLSLFFTRRGPGTIFGGPDPLQELFVKDVTEGIASTGIRAAVVKCATGPRGITPGVERVIRAVAATHLRTGVPISTHADAATFRGRDQLRLLRELGVKPDKVVIGHCGDSTDLSYHTELMDAGCFIGMDRFGIDTILSTRERSRVVAELANRGYADRMLLSHDANSYTTNWDPERRAELLPDWNFEFISTCVLDELRERGVSERDITQMTVTNPAALFS
jgi:phosphotriesterase-related protein